MPQKLSPGARARKLKRDKEYAMTPRRRAMKAENQRLRRNAIKRGVNLAGLDYDHEDKKFESIKRNRGNDGNGTKTEKA
jgi:hypothetical protein